jgi:hypothetical protein
MGEMDSRRSLAISSQTAQPSLGRMSLCSTCVGMDSRAFKQGPGYKYFSHTFFLLRFVM